MVATVTRVSNLIHVQNNLQSTHQCHHSRTCLWPGPEKGMNAQCDGFKCEVGNNGLLLPSTSILTAWFHGPEVPFRVNHLMWSHVIVTSVIFTRNSIGNTTVSFILMSNTRNPQQTQERVPKKLWTWIKVAPFIHFLTLQNFRNKHFAPYVMYYIRHQQNTFLFGLIWGHLVAFDCTWPNRIKW